MTRLQQEADARSEYVVAWVGFGFSLIERQTRRLGIVSGTACRWVEPIRFLFPTWPKIADGPRYTGSRTTSTPSNDYFRQSLRI